MPGRRAAADRREVMCGGGSDADRTRAPAGLGCGRLRSGGDSFPVVDGKGCVKVRTNWYSTPLAPGLRPRVKLLPAYVEIWQERECVARHERSFGRYEQVLDLEHYLEVLE